MKLLKRIKERPEFALLIILFVVFIVYDIVHVTTQTIDINKHLPFFFPLVLLGFMSIQHVIDTHRA